MIESQRPMHNSTPTQQTVQVNRPICGARTLECNNLLATSRQPHLSIHPVCIRDEQILDCVQTPAVQRSATSEPGCIMGSKRLAAYIGSVINQLRTEQGLTLQALADESGVSKSYLGDIEKGRKNPTTDIVESIANALDIPPRRLIYHASMQEEESIFLPEQLILEADPEAEVEQRELAQLAHRLRAPNSILFTRYRRTHQRQGTDKVR